jgi:hypothetical protein
VDPVVERESAARVGEGLDEREIEAIARQLEPRDARVDANSDGAAPHAPSLHAQLAAKDLSHGFFGSSGRNRKTSGFLKLASRWRQNSPRSSADAVAPGRSATNAATRWPHSSSGTPTTAASSTAGCDTSTASTSAGAMFSPPRMIMSSLRPAT